MNDTEHSLPPAAPAESRPERGRLPQYSMVFALAALLLPDGFSAVPAVPGSVAWTPKMVLISLAFAVPAGLTALHSRNRAGHHSDGPTVQRPDRGRP